MAWFFVFFVSGFCSILYELVWLRLAMASFGVTSDLVSIVLSMFMAGLGLGSWISGRLLRRYELNRSSALRIYGSIEFLIAVSALLVPKELFFGRQLLQHLEFSSSVHYYLASGIWLALTLVPWCACMGATIPVGMQAIRCEFRSESPRAFSFLYLANVLGAVAGATIPLLIIEAWGFHGALATGTVLNVLIAFSATTFSFRRPSAHPGYPRPCNACRREIELSSRSSKLLALLFTTGLTSMGMKLFGSGNLRLISRLWCTPSLPSWCIAVHLRRVPRLSPLEHRPHARAKRAWMLLGLCALLPLVTASPKIHLFALIRPRVRNRPFSAPWVCNSHAG